MLLVLLLANLTASAATNRHVIESEGEKRRYQVALEELHDLDRDKSVPVPPADRLKQVEGVQSKARALEAASGRRHALVLYPEGQPRTPENRRVVTRQVLVQLKDGADADALAAAHNVRCLPPISFAPGYRIFEAGASSDALALAPALRTHPSVISAEPMLKRTRTLRTVPNDPLFHNQWHLNNTNQNGAATGIDVNVTNVWDTFTGAGIVVSVVDDGYEHSHEDLAPNSRTDIDWDYRSGDDDPSPEGGTGANAQGNPNADSHGVAVAGLIAAKGNNNLGSAGVAYNATMVGIRLIGGSVGDLEEASAVNHSNQVIHISNNSWGGSDDGKTKGGGGPMFRAALVDATANGRGGKGSIIMWAAGNGGLNIDNANFDNYANSIYTVAVGALNDQGWKADYSEPGSCLVIAAPSGGETGDTPRLQATTTTDVAGDRGYNRGDKTIGPVNPEELSDRNYTQTFNGTSAATPVASGVMALVLNANPNIGWRDAQAILIQSATRTQPGRAGWITNGAGLRFHHDVGAGLVNAGAAVALGQTWTNLGPQLCLAETRSMLGQAIPDDNATGVSATFNLPSATNLCVEHVVVTVNLSHPARGQLAIDLISPSGTRSFLATTNADPNADFTDFSLMSVFNWGEASQGTWTVEVRDTRSGEVGTLNAVGIKVYGAIKTPPSTNAAPTIACPADLLVNATNGQCSASVSFSPTVSGSPAPSVACSLGNAPISSPHTFPVGTNVVSCVASNAAGTSACSFTVVVRDNTAPGITCPVGPVVSADPGSCGAVVTFAPVASDNCGTPTVQCAPPSGSFFTVGTRTVLCTATDASGNGNTCAFSVTVLDNQAPALMCPGSFSVTVPAGVSSTNVTFSFSATDNCGVFPAVCIPASGSAFPTGMTPVQCTAGDAAGNSNTCSFTVTVAAAPTNVVDPGCLISHWRFDESGGLTALDSSDGNPGLLVNGPARVPGVSGGSLEFNGVNQYVNVPHSSLLNVPQRFAISLWFRPGQTLTAASGRKDLFKKFLSYWVILNYPANDGRLAFVLNSGGAVVRSTTTNWTAGQWYHVVATHDGATMSLFVNGMLEATNRVGVSAVPSSFPVQIGGNTEQRFWFPGAMDDIRLFCTNLPASAVSALFSDSTTPPPNTSPTISDMTDRTIAANSNTGDIPFTVGDNETPAGSLLVSATSGNTMLLPNAGITFGGSGAARTLRATPTPGQTGSALITVTVSDGLLTASDTFVLTVTNAPPPPVGTNALIGRWMFDESSGLTAMDSAGPNPGMLVNGPLRVAGRVGSGALQFNGANHYVNVPDQSALDLGSQFSISFWLRPSQLLNASSGRRDFLQKFLSYWVILNYPANDGRIAFVLNSGTPIVKSTTSSWNAMQWYHVAATYDGTTMRLYVNGVLEGSAPANVTPNNTSFPLQFGGNTTQRYWCPGAMDDVRLFGNALDATDVTALFNGSL